MRGSSRGTRVMRCRTQRVRLEYSCSNLSLIFTPHPARNTRHLPLKGKAFEFFASRLFFAKKQKCLQIHFCLSKNFPCQESLAKRSLSISLMTVVFLRLQRGASKSSAMPSPVRRAMTVSGGNSSMASATRLM